MYIVSKNEFDRPTNVIASLKKSKHTSFVSVFPLHRQSQNQINWYRLQVTSRVFDLDAVLHVYVRNVHMIPVLTKWATSRQGNKGDICLIEHFKNYFLKKTTAFLKEIMGFGPQIRQQPWHIIYHFKAYESGQH